MSTHALVLENRHTGERLELQRFVDTDGTTSLALKGTLPPRRQGPPLHIHYAQDEEGHVLNGTLSVEVDGQRTQVPAGRRAVLPKGRPHRWWNDGDERLEFEGIARPAVDLDRYLAAVFDVMNAGSAERPPLFYIAHVAWRHRRTQEVCLLPRAVQSVVFPLIVLVGTLLGRYRGRDWPGAPERYADAPMALETVGT